MLIKTIRNLIRYCSDRILILEKSCLAFILCGCVTFTFAANSATENLVLETQQPINSSVGLAIEPEAKRGYKIYGGFGGGISRLQPVDESSAADVGSDNMSPGSRGFIGLIWGANSLANSERLAVEIDYADLGKVGLVNQNTGEDAGDLYYKVIGVSVVSQWLFDQSPWGLEARIRVSAVMLDNQSTELVREIHDINLGAGAALFFDVTDSWGLRLFGDFYASDAALAGLDLIYRTSLDIKGVKEVKSISVDDDDDGIVNNRDLCPDTPPNSRVDLTGCLVREAIVADSDGDGILDSKDLCPGTPAICPVDQVGCVVPNAVNRITIEGKALLTYSIPFGYRDLKFEPAQSRRLTQIAAYLATNPEQKIELISHTSWESNHQGPHNIKYSNRRLALVEDFLTSRGVHPVQIVYQKILKSRLLPKYINPNRARVVDISPFSTIMRSYEPGCFPQTTLRAKDRELLTYTIKFGYRVLDIDQISQQKMNEMAQFLVENPQHGVHLVCHTSWTSDRKGPHNAAFANMRLLLAERYLRNRGVQGGQVRYDLLKPAKPFPQNINSKRARELDISPVENAQQ